MLSDRVATVRQTLLGGLERYPGFLNNHWLEVWRGRKCHLGVAVFECQKRWINSLNFLLC